MLNNKYDFMVFFDVRNGNPNGDPDAGNMPRVDPETGHGLVTDGCLKRKIRNYVELMHDGETGKRIYVKSGVTLNSCDNEAYAEVGIPDAASRDDNDLKAMVKAKKAEGVDVDTLVRDWMCKNFYDIRTFGAVMTTMTRGRLNCGQVRGPVQFSFARSVEPVVPQDVTITRVAITKDSDADNKNNEIGHKYIIPYGLYCVEGHVSANLANKTTGFDEDDLELLWDAIMNMFEEDRAAARGDMNVRKLIIFKHGSKHGSCPAWKLYEAVKVSRVNDTMGLPARSYHDYEVTIDEAAIPAGVEVIVK